MLRLVSIVFAGCLLLPVATWAEVTEVDDASLQELIEQGTAVIDVRRRDEWQRTGVIEGSHLMTFWDAKGNYDVEAWLAGLADVASPDEPVVLICQTGYRSHVISTFLDQKVRYSQVHNVTRGISQWIRNGRPTVAYE